MALYMLKWSMGVITKLHDIDDIKLRCCLAQSGETERVIGRKRERERAVVCGCKEVRLRFPHGTLHIHQQQITFPSPPAHVPFHHSLHDCSVGSRVRCLLWQGQAGVERAYQIPLSANLNISSANILLLCVSVYCVVLLVVGVHTTDETIAKHCKGAMFQTIENE